MELNCEKGKKENRKNENGNLNLSNLKFLSIL